MGKRRRNKDSDIVKSVAQLVALTFLVAMLVPSVGQFLIGSAIIMFCLIMLVVVVALIVLFIRRHHRRLDHRSPFATHNYSSSPSPTRPENYPAMSESDPIQPTVDLIQQLRSIDWFQFEKVVALTYKKLGYSVNPRGGANPDGGIDLVIEKTGQQKAVQCKQWKTWNVGVKAVREFLGALTDAKIEHGVFVTLSGYTSEAKLLADKHGIEILNEAELAKMLESAGANHDPEVLALLNDKRKYCPKCEETMILRTSKKGLGSGNQFWGCSTYPKCRFTMPVN